MTKAKVAEEKISLLSIALGKLEEAKKLIDEADCLMMEQGLKQYYGRDRTYTEETDNPRVLTFSLVCAMDAAIEGVEKRVKEQ